MDSSTNEVSFKYVVQLPSLVGSCMSKDQQLNTTVLFLPIVTHNCFTQIYNAFYQAQRRGTSVY